MRKRQRKQLKDGENKEKRLKSKKRERKQQEERENNEKR